MMKPLYRRLVYQQRDLQPYERRQRHFLPDRGESLRPELHVPVRRLYGEQSGYVHRAGPVSRGRDVQSVDGGVLQPGSRQRDELQRRECLHADRLVPGGSLHRGESSHVHGARFLPQRRRLHCIDGGLLGGDAQRRLLLHRRRVRSFRCYERREYVRDVSAGSEHVAVFQRERWDVVQRRECVRPERLMPIGHVHSWQPRDLHGARFLPQRRRLQRIDGGVLGADTQRRLLLHQRRVRGLRRNERRQHVPDVPAGSEYLAVFQREQWDVVQRRECMHPGRYLPSWRLHREQSRRLHSERPMPRCRKLQSKHSGVLESRRSERHPL